MMELKRIDKISDYNDLLIELEAQLERKNFSREILIREIFVLWYILVEGIKCEDFSSDILGALLKKRYRFFKENFDADIYFNFIVGWMLNVAPWFVKDDLSEDDGNELLRKAYKMNPENSLYKWALRSQLKLNEDDINELKKDLKENFDSYFNYGRMIKEYFLSMLK